MRIGEAILSKYRLLAPLTDSILVEAAHQTQFPCPKVSKWRVICIASVKENMFGKFIDAAQLKTLAKYSIEFNDLAVQMRPHRIAYLRLLGCLLYTSPSPRDGLLSRMPSSA